MNGTLLFPRQATTSRTLSMTLRMKPPPFQFGSAGCASPLALVQRALSVNAPNGGPATCALHWRKPYLPWSGPSAAARQVDPPSPDNWTSATPQSPPNAIPLTESGSPGLTVAPSCKFVKKERGAIRLIGTVENPLSPGFTLACGVSGIR